MTEGTVTFAAPCTTLLLPAGQAQPHTRVNLAEWLPQHHSSANPAALSSDVAVDFSLENLSGFGDLLRYCAGLTSLEATGNSITSLAGLLSNSHSNSKRCLGPCLTVLA